MLEKAANFDDPVKRIAAIVMSFCTIANTSKLRTRKPFNAMLGETFELVTDRCRFFSEKV